MTDEEKWNTALFIAIDDLNEPNDATRKRALEAGVFEEFYKIRQLLIQDAHSKFTEQKL